MVEFVGVRKSFDGKSVLHSFSLNVEPGGFVTLLGPSGCGKTTVLRLLGGFEAPDQGRILIDGRDVTDLPPERRAVNTVFQSYALFPHLSVRENIGFGLRMQGADAAAVRREVDAALDLVNLRGMGRRKPDELSGGQQQRVAIARALVNKPLVLLLDESLSALDRGLRKRMQAELKALQRRLGITFLFVTHDQEEAFAMSDKVVVMNEGRIEQIGTPREIYEEPANMFTARFVGEINVLEGTILEREGDAWLARVEGERLRLSAGRGFVPGERVDILLRPEDFQIVPMGHLDEDPETREKFEANGFFSGEVVGTLYKGATYDMTIRLGSGETVLATQFFDEDSEKVAYAAGDAVAVHWYPGWEVVFTHDGQ